MAKQNKFARSFKLNGQLIRLSKGETKETVLKFVDVLEPLLDKNSPDYNPEIKQTGICSGNDALAAALKAKGLL